MLAPAWKRTSFKVLMGSNNARLMALFHQQQLGLYADQSETKAHWFEHVVFADHCWDNLDCGRLDGSIHLDTFALAIQNLLYILTHTEFFHFWMEPQPINDSTTAHPTSDSTPDRHDFVNQVRQSM